MPGVVIEREQTVHDYIIIKEVEKSVINLALKQGTSDMTALSCILILSG